MALLDYENQMYLESFHDDALVVLAKGIGAERLAVNLIKTYNDPGNLVLVIGSTTVDEEFIIEKLKSLGETLLPKVITSDVGTKDRRNVYMEGGVLFVSSRILVVDMLVDRVPIDLITGIIVLRAHKILESCQEAFIVRLYRMKNNKGFIKAISSNPSAFTRGFAQVQRVMRNLFVKHLFIWPRFHAVVASSLERAKPDVMEMHVPMTMAMTSIQISLLDLMNVCVKELKHINPSLDTDELTVENAIAKSFDKIIKYQLDPIWHQLNAKTKRLIADLKFLRSVLLSVTQQDCVTFYNMLKMIKENITVGTQMSDWLFLDASDSLFLHAKERVFGSSKKKDSSKTETLNFEENAKWKPLCEVLNEISNECTDEEKQMVIVIVNDDYVSKQLIDVLTIGGEEYLYNRFQRLFPKICAEMKSNRKTRKRKLKDDEQTLTQMIGEKDEDEEQEIALSISELEKKFPKLFIEFYSIKHSVSNHFRFQTLCDLHHPKYMVFYDGDMELIRRIELYQALNPKTRIKVYFLIYSGSSEEQSFLTSLRREKEAFEYLIREKASLVLPEGIDGKSNDHPDLVRGSSLANETVNSRKAGGQIRKLEDQKVIVDMREFRSELPSLIHRRGIDVVPVTLEVGDYVLTPDMVVERKSVSDLIGSLNSGRLYTQAQSMCLLYKKPILLIEFDQNKAFSMQGKYYFTSSASSQNVISKLILLTCHFPQLRILWCSSPYATSEMFELLKVKREQPDEEKAALMRVEENASELSISKFNPIGYDFISKLPGINSKNIWPILNNVSSIADLVNYSEEDFNKKLGNSVNAKTLWKSINEEMVSDVGVSTSKFKKTWKSRKT
ncbi:DNA repair endonuclease XPF [Parasteatoda tepidariorum]|uniref:DNA repair endonuclease XPF n=1 Tax=Parasteatoda tepidariorum TaxID=114398 RepID=UPI00077FC624|nr:DNA repair endonuclease XPF isoform X1 [Parasteatoda tepidariorum]XP_042901351.1 DNA repair endonuclease XPF isoform X2 [Parasteatoda tepidariorum]